MKSHMIIMSTFFALQLSVSMSGYCQNATLVGPLQYFSSQDSPFTNTNFSDSFLEDFEDGQFNTPFATVSGDGNNSFVFGPGGTVDSVDADDGAIDGSGTGGRSFVVSPPFPTAVVEFESIDGIGLPTHVGIVWTDGQPSNQPTTTFEVFGASGTSLGSLEAKLADGSINGTTAEDAFFGAIAPNGISRITISNDNTSVNGIEVDHIFYGIGNVLLGDINRDGNVDLLDVSPFVDLLTEGAYQIEGDINGDGAVNLLDVAPFIELLTGG